jgi:hypothetical protein
VCNAHRSPCRPARLWISYLDIVAVQSFFLKKDTFLVVDLLHSDVWVVTDLKKLKGSILQKKNLHVN